MLVTTDLISVMKSISISDQRCVYSWTDRVACCLTSMSGVFNKIESIDALDSIDIQSRSLLWLLDRCNRI